MRVYTPYLCQVLLGLVFASLATASGAETTSVTDPHAKHRMMLAKPDVRIERSAYAVPDVRLTNASGQPVDFRSLMASDRPLAMNFIFTTCTTICPVMTATMLQLQKYLDGDTAAPDFISISIDPDYDTAAVMHEYAEHYGANWTFLTGSAEDIGAVLKSFDAYRGNKVNHFPLTLMRAANESEWTRIEGLTSAEELARVWRDISQ